VPTRLSGVAYQVRYGIHVVGEAFSTGEESASNAMGPSVQCISLMPDEFPGGSYFLYYTDNGKVHQLKSIEGKWHCLAMAA